jgi:hypothetical protein
MELLEYRGIINNRIYEIYLRGEKPFFVKTYIDGTGGELSGRRGCFVELV